jgi:hypothetical protein
MVLESNGYKDANCAHTELVTVVVLKSVTE